MRKFVSLILCLSMLSALLCAPASAASHTSTDPTSTYVQLSDGTYLIANDLPDGNAKFSITNSHGDILAESYLDRSSQSIYNTDLRTGNNEVVTVPAKNQLHTSNKAVTPKGSDIPIGFTYRGKITYNFYGSTDHVVGTRALNIYYDYNSYLSSRYNVAGVYQNIASFASLIASLLTLPAAIASSSAAVILERFGFATGAISFLIPDHYVRCNETEITWIGQVTDFPDVYATISGSKYVLTEEGYESQIYTSGDFWPTSSYTNRNTNFAVKIYWTALGQDTLEIVSWS